MARNDGIDRTCARIIEACRQQEKVDYMLSLTEDPADWAFFHKEYEKEVTRIERRIEEYLVPADVGGAA